MSLKAFHIVFIIFSTLLALGTGVWCLWINLLEGAPIYAAGAVASFVVAIALLVPPALSRLGRVVVAGCRDAAAARTRGRRSSAPRSPMARPAAANHSQRVFVVLFIRDPPRGRNT